MPVTGGTSLKPSTALMVSPATGTWAGYIGKGIKEPVAPYRELYVFGAPFGSFPPPNNWNAPPDIWDPTDTFDLSKVPPGVEVVIILVRNYSLPPGTYTAQWRLYRDSDGSLLYQGDYSVTLPYTAWIYFYLITGYISTEYYQNGAYHINLDIGGPESWTKTFNLSITGIPPSGPPPLPSGDWIDKLVEYAASLSNTMASWAATWKQWSWPMNMVTPLIVALSAIADGIFGALFDFEIWIRALIDKLATFLNWEEIKAKLQDFLNMVADLWDWFENKLEYIKTIMSDWWDSASNTVKEWISTATQGLAELLTAWDDFRTAVLPTLIDSIKLDEWWRSRLADVGGLIDSRLKEWFPFYDDLAQTWDSIASFFVNPLDWLLDHFTDWFLGGEK